METIHHTFGQTDIHKVRNILRVIANKFPCFIYPHYQKKEVAIVARNEDIAKIKKILEFIK